MACYDVKHYSWANISICLSLIYLVYLLHLLSSHLIVDRPDEQFVPQDAAYLSMLSQD